MFDAIAVFAIAFSLILWRISYFGYPFPNICYAKVSGNLTDNLKRGAAYLIDFFTIIRTLFFIAGTLLLPGKAANADAEEAQ